jgi:AraC-like DNA-binding protein
LKHATRRPHCKNATASTARRATLPGPARGVLRGSLPAAAGQHGRYPAPDDLAPWVEHFWHVTWDLRGQPPARVETLPHPSVHLVFEGDRAELVGVSSRRFERQLKDLGSVFGIKLRPGGLRGFIDAPAASLRDRRRPLREVFGAAADVVQRQVMTDVGSPPAMVAHACAFLRALRPRRDPRAETLGDLVLRVRDDRTMLRVDALARAAGTGIRDLQRQFRDFIGVGPKWVISRYRIHEALEQVHAERRIDWAALAQALGYFDQAHFIRDFRRMVGVTPRAYALRARRSG